MTPTELSEADGSTFNKPFHLLLSEMLMDEEISEEVNTRLGYLQKIRIQQRLFVRGF